MTTIAVVMATALLVAVAVVAIVQAVRGAEQATAQATASAEAAKITAVLAAGRREREVLLRVLAAAAFAAVAVALWYSSPVAAAFAEWMEAALPAWLGWLI